ncbi:MAG TPA: hypothetical protein VFH74_08645 [Gaiellales bacterium]|nr:hypothetical protein [Gaiellales bacterium]
MSEYEQHSKKRSGEDESPDVEAHSHFKKRGEDGPSPIEAEHHSKKHSDDDDGPDVEAHLFANR